MIFVDIPFPPRLAMGIGRKVGWRTTVAMTQGGYENAVQNWLKARHTFDAAFAVRDATDFADIEAHFHSVRARTYKFPLSDPLDNRVEASAGILIPDVGSPSNGYQLAKTYGSGPYPYRRAITRPRVDTVAIYRLRAGVTTAITGSATISATTGRVEFDATVVQHTDVLSWSGRFWVPCRYDIDELPAVVVNRRPGGGELLVDTSGITIVEVKE
jgi:uncharacterized protein (TIGR02217 family)